MQFEITLKVRLNVESDSQKAARVASVSAVENALRLVEGNGFNYDDDTTESVMVADVIFQHSKPKVK